MAQGQTHGILEWIWIQEFEYCCQVSLKVIHERQESGISHYSLSIGAVLSGSASGVLKYVVAQGANGTDASLIVYR